MSDNQCLDNIKIRNRGFLPHWEISNGIYFITYRLHDSLPAYVLEKIERKKLEIIRKSKKENKILHNEEFKHLERLVSFKLDTYLDSGKGACYLKIPEIASMIADNLGYFNNDRYRLHAWCIMPNHIHVVVQVYSENSLDRILHSWKSYSSHMANRYLNRSGKFWQREYYDHLIRDKNEFYKAIKYVAYNPFKSGLTGWEWVWVNEEYLFDEIKEVILPESRKRYERGLTR